MRFLQTAPSRRSRQALSWCWQKKTTRPKYGRRSADHEEGPGAHRGPGHAGLRRTGYLPPARPLARPRLLPMSCLIDLITRISTDSSTTRELGPPSIIVNPRGTTTTLRVQALLAAPLGPQLQPWYHGLTYLEASGEPLQHQNAHTFCDSMYPPSPSDL